MNESHLTILVVYSIVIFLAPFWLRKSHSRGSIQDTVNALGILGTFAGIAWGLFHLDIQNLQDGIPILIRYLSYGFVASIVGFVASLLVKHTDIYGIKEGTKDASEKELLEEIKEELKRVNMNLSGEGETTLVTQIQKMRTTTSDKLDELNKSFNEFAKNVAENNSQALIKALEEVMRDFNAKINEQFGENFKQLNEAVGRILVWQENYKSQIEISTQALNSSASALELSSKSLNSSEETMQAASKHAEEFSSLAVKLREELDIMSQFLGGIKTLSETLSGSGEQIKRDMDELVKKNLEALSKNGDEINKKMEELTSKSLETLGVNLASISEKLVADYREVQRAMGAMAGRN